MPCQHCGKKMRIEPPRVLERVDNRLLRPDSQVDRHVSQRQIEIDQQGSLFVLLGQGYGNTAGQGCHSATALGAEKHEQLAVGRHLHGVS